MKAISISLISQILIITVSTSNILSNKKEIKSIKTPIIFGEKAIVYINTTRLLKSDSKSQTAWSIITRNQSTHIIAVNAVSIDPIKYRMLSDAYSCRLEIDNFEPSDVGVTYAFSNHFKTYKIRLEMDQDIFELPPSMNTTSISEFYKEGSVFTITVNYSKVYPRPQCQAQYEGKNITSTIQTDIKSVGLVFASTHTAVVVLKNGSTFKMGCRVGRFLYNIRNVTFMIPHDYTGHFRLSSTLFLVIFTTNAFTVAVMLIIINYKKLRGCFVITYYMIENETTYQYFALSCSNSNEQGNTPVH